jgi:hypothetical protein
MGREGLNKVKKSQNLKESKLKRVKIKKSQNLKESKFKRVKI